MACNANANILLAKSQTQNKISSTKDANASNPGPSSAASTIKLASEKIVWGKSLSRLPLFSKSHMEAQRKKLEKDFIR